MNHNSRDEPEIRYIETIRRLAGKNPYMRSSAAHRAALV
jgi:hypothetical protein